MIKPSQEEIGLEMAVAWEALDDAESNLEEGRFRTAISRAYYAIFHAARAVVWTREVAPKTHKGLAQQFGQNIVQTGVTSREFSTILKNASDERELADYHAMTGSFEREDVEKLVAEARMFVKEMKRILEEDV